ncbi:fungal-specific transcription factor [Truncatella angustata]|uniref:Fungal-specific transcription factor n=1 Tax=Truncatella angustata TaxID=152316 RepID=A0A9P9A266_9PEZI|nr:fungal-specific transcription factor [Truncatella angustata]KAH6657650.1 fungal-specific transcription factor [Truncatella angustata]
MANILHLQPTDNRVQGRLALVTGASGGIGSSCARALAAEGCDIALHYSSSKDKADALAKELGDNYPSQLFVAVPADLKSRESTHNLVPSVLTHEQIASRHSAISILVANAGLGRRIRDVADIGEDDWDEMMEVNIRSQFVVTKAAVATMRAQSWGRIILIGSIASRGSGLNGCHYAASKGALSSMGLNLATLLAAEGITVNIVSPAMIGQTGMIPEPKSTTWEKGTDIDALKAQDPGLGIAASVPVHRLGTPGEVSGMVVIDSNGVQGQPPCRRCIELGQECVLGGSRRGGRRVKGMRSSRAAVPSGHSAVTQSVARQNEGIDAENRDSSRGQGDAERSQSDDDMLNSDDRDDQTTARASPERNWREPAPDQQWTQIEDDRQGLEGHIANSDLLNPADALHLLAQVADLESDEQSGSPGPSTIATNMSAPGRGNVPPGTYYYPPISDGHLTVSDAAFLIQHYHDKFHPFFPVAHRDIFFDKNVMKWTREEQHLLTAILAVATKDEPNWSRAHDACSQHMESLVTKLIYTGSTTVGAVEALLILAEWAPQSPQENAAIGCGKEDPGSWMLVGLAIRLGYLQKLEQTGLIQGQDSESEHTSRQKIAWAACYMSDRAVSIRLGKGFWSRGPGPSTHLRAADFPSLQVQTLGADNLALLFQAHLELTQLFGNAHDILYSSTRHREQLYMGGEYVRYIDDFTSVLRRWKIAWGGLSLTPHVKSSLMLSYDFLRLYINAFAFQANLNRAIHQAQSKARNKVPVGRLWSSDVAGTPDARFIYESIDAANSLLSTLNGFIDPETGLKYMPLRFYLYIIYAAVFLYKATLAGPISGADAASVRRAVRETIQRLQKTSSNRHSLGNRYARSLQLLWRRPSSKAKPGPGSDMTSHRTSVTIAQNPSPGLFRPAGNSNQVDLDQLNGFSWWDLDSLGQFIANDQTANFTDGVMSTPDMESENSVSGIESSTAGLWYSNLWDGSDVIF